MTEPLVYTVEEAAKFCRVGRSAMYAAVRRGEIPGVIRVGRVIRISRHQLEAMLGLQDDESPVDGRAPAQDTARTRRDVAPG